MVYVDDIIGLDEGETPGLVRLNDPNLLDILLTSLRYNCTRMVMHRFSRREIWTKLNIDLMEAGYGPIVFDEYENGLLQFETCDPALFTKNIGAVNFFKEYVKCYFENRDYIHEKLETAYDASENRRYMWLLERVDSRMNLTKKIDIDSKVKKQVTSIDLNIDIDKIDVPFITSEQQMIEAFAEYERKLLDATKGNFSTGGVAPGENQYVEQSQ